MPDLEGEECEREREKQNWEGKKRDREEEKKNLRANRRKKISRVEAEARRCLDVGRQGGDTG